MEAAFLHFLLEMQAFAASRELWLRRRDGELFHARGDGDSLMYGRERWNKVRVHVRSFPLVFLYTHWYQLNKISPNRSLIFYEELKSPKGMGMSCSE